MTQQLIDFSAPIPVNASVPVSDAPRLSKQCRLILERLRQGKATNRGAVGNSLEVHRTAERNAGNRIQNHSICDRNYDSGLVVYELEVTVK